MQFVRGVEGKSPIVLFLGFESYKRYQSFTIEKSQPHYEKEPDLNVHKSGNAASLSLQDVVVIARVLCFNTP